VTLFDVAQVFRPAVRRFFERLGNVLRHTRAEDDLERETAAHLALLEEDYQRRGMTREDARFAARRAFGGVEQTKELHRDARSFRWIDDARRDLQYAVRTLRKAPGFTTVAVLTLALGIGANSAIFTLIDAVLMKSLPVHDPGRLVLLGDARSSGVGTRPRGSFPVYSHELYQHLRDAHVLDALCAFQSADAQVSVRRAGSSAVGAAGARLVSGNYFDVLGVHAAVGRTLAPFDDSPSAPPVSVVSFRYWKNALDGDPSVVGSTIDLNGVAVAIVGVAAPEFYGDRLQPDPPSFWLPISADRQLDPQRSVVDDPDQYWLYLMGRLMPNVSAAQTQVRLTVALQNWLLTRDGSSVSAERRREISNSRVELNPGQSGVTHMRRNYSQTLRLLLGISAAVLLITCANLANLLLTRGTARRTERSVRLALGASRGRLVRQSLTESLTLALAGGALALLVASAGTKLLVVLVFRGADYVPIQIAPDVRVLAFTFAISCGAAIVFGLLPAIRMSSDIAPAIKGGSRVGLGQALIVGEVALSLVLLAAAVSFARSLANVAGQAFGFDREQILIVDVDPGLARYEYSRLGPLYQQMESRLNSLPGVKSASFSHYSPFNGCCWAFSVAVEGYTPKPREGTSVLLNRVSPRYFETLGTKVRRGRVFDEHDTPASRRVAVVSDAFVHRFLLTGDPIGRRFGIGDRNSGDLEIIGVVENAKYDDPREEPEPMAFLPLLQVKPGDEVSPAFVHAIEVRSTANPTAIAGQVRQALADIDPRLPVLRVDALSDQIARTLNQEIVIADLAVFFGLLGLVLTCVGVYGLMAYLVQRRTSEIAIRIALGARPGAVIGMVIRDALVQGVVGLLVGIPAAFAMARLVANQLYGVSPTDPKASATAALVLILCITIAGYVPARRASRIDAMRALRDE
jgi:macrolide transport system ATP-binding/permease protein